MTLLIPLLSDPRLTTRHRGHLPVRIVMSRCLRLPENANLWDVSIAQTIVMTQRGVRKDFQTLLASRGVEVVEFDFLTPRAVMEFDFLTPRAVMEYCYHRGFLSVLWECGGMLSAPAISSGVIHKVLPSSLFLCSDLYLHGDDDDKVLINLNK